MMCVSQDTILTYATTTNYIILLFTDDPSYETWLENFIAENALGEYVLCFWALHEEPRDANASSEKGARYVRATSPAHAMTEFCTMALCNMFIGTSGSTVTHLVTALNQRYMTIPFEEVTLIGDWHTPERPTNAFRRNISDMIKNGTPHLMKPGMVNITHEQATVLAFLTDAHLEEIYKTMLRTFRQGFSVSAAYLGQQLMNECRVAKLNRGKFLECDHTKAHNQHWMTALIRGRLNTWIHASDEADYKFEMDKERGMVNLVPKDDYTHALASSFTGGSSSSASGMKRKHEEVVLD